MSERQKENYLQAIYALVAVSLGVLIVELVFKLPVFVVAIGVQLAILACCGLYAAANPYKNTNLIKSSLIRYGQLVGFVAIF